MFIIKKTVLETSHRFIIHLIGNSVDNTQKCLCMYIHIWFKYFRDTFYSLHQNFSMNKLINKVYFSSLQKSLRFCLQFTYKFDSFSTLPLLILLFVTLHVVILSMAFVIDINFKSTFLIKQNSDIRRESK